MKKTIFGLLFFTGISFSQPLGGITIKFNPPFCNPTNPDGVPMVLAFINSPSIIPGVNLTNFPVIPTCLRLGTGLKINLNAIGGPALEMRTDLQTSPVVPVQVSETFSLRGISSTTKDIVLKYGPSPNSVILLIYQDIPRVSVSIKTIQTFGPSTVVGSSLRIEVPELHSDEADVTIIYTTFSGCAPDRPGTPGCQ